MNTNGTEDLTVTEARTYTDRRRAADPMHDPIVSIAFMISDLDTSKATFYRHHKARLEIVEVSPRRRGCRLSDYLRYKASLRRV